MPGVPVWYFSTAIHRAQLPFAQISTYVSLLPSQPITLPAHVTLHLADCAGYSDESASESAFARFDWLQPLTETDILHRISELTFNSSQLQFTLSLDHDFECRSFLAVLGSDLVHPGSDTESDTTSDQGERTDERLDSWLHQYLESNPSGPPHSLTFFIINIPPTPSPSPYPQGAVVGTHRHAFTLPTSLTQGSFLETTLPLAARVVSQYFLQGGVAGSPENATPGRDLPVSASGEAVLSFSLLNADPGQRVYDW